MTTRPTFLFSSGTLFQLPNWPEEPTRTPLIDVGMREDLERDYNEAKSAALEGKIQVAEESVRAIKWAIWDAIKELAEAEKPYTIEVQGAMEIRWQSKTTMGNWTRIGEEQYNDYIKRFDKNWYRKVAVFVPSPETAYDEQRNKLANRMEKVNEAIDSTAPKEQPEKLTFDEMQKAFVNRSKIPYCKNYNHCAQFRHLPKEHRACLCDEREPASPTEQGGEWRVDCSEFNGVMKLSITDGNETLISYYDYDDEKAAIKLAGFCMTLNGRKLNAAQDTLPMDFVLWYSGMKAGQILNAFDRWQRETITRKSE